MNWLLAAAAAPVAAVGGWIGWRWYSTGRAPSMADVIPFARRSPDAVINTWAEKNDVDPALVRGVVKIESAGTDLVDGRPVVRVEVHLLQREAGRSGAKRRKLDQVLDRSGGGEPWEGHKVNLGDGWQALHGQPGEPLRESQAREWAALALAKQAVGEEAAIRSSSFGLGQLLGRHHKALGYRTAAAMLEDAERGETAQIDQMLRFIEVDRAGAMLRALQAGELLQFAIYYNGAGQAQRYATKIARAAGVGISPSGQVV